jgi:acetyl esterase/lipase
MGWLTHDLLAMQMGVFYLVSKRVLRSIPYGPKARNRLDMYIPRHHWRNPDVCIPVVIYVTGGCNAASHARPIHRIHPARS